jgi:hypothetical protein
VGSPLSSDFRILTRASRSKLMPGDMKAVKQISHERPFSSVAITDENGVYQD